jgi:putative transposase
VFPQRKHPAHFPAFESGNRAIIIFVTVCVRDRRRLLAEDAIHRLVLASWVAADHWNVGRYVVMPDHVHLFCAPATWPPSPLGGWIGYWKNLTTRAWPRSEEKPVWQQNHWDTQLRRGDSYAAKWNYVRNNPVRHGLVQRPEDWPFAGELCELRWHDR